MDDEWARWDGDQVRLHAQRLALTYFAEGRLPFPAAARVREAHVMLSDIVAHLDAKLEELE